MISERERRKLQATGYLESRLQTNPQTARYSHCLAALYEDDHKGTEAGRTYKNAIKSAPNDVMVRNDYGLHLAYGGRKQDGVDEFRKALLINPDQPTLHKNLGAIEASRGNYVIAQSSLQQALHSNPSDAVNHRNFAKVREALGDTRTALKHNLASIALEAKFNKYPSDTTSHRLAAVQNITLGGDLEYSLELMTAARQKEGKEFDSFEFVSRRRTEELIQQISHRKGSPTEVLEKMLAEQQDRRSLEEAVRKGDVSAILKHRGMGGQAKKR